MLIGAMPRFGMTFALRVRRSQGANLTRDASTGRRPPVLVSMRLAATAARASRRRTSGMRHTYATLALDSGIEPKVPSDRVGHTNPGITFRIYAHRSTGGIETPGT